MHCSGCGRSGPFPLCAGCRTLSRVETLWKSLVESDLGVGLGHLRDCAGALTDLAEERLGEASLAGGSGVARPPEPPGGPPKKKTGGCRREGEGTGEPSCSWKRTRGEEERSSWEEANSSQGRVSWVGRRGLLLRDRWGGRGQNTWGGKEGSEDEEASACGWRNPSQR